MRRILVLAVAAVIAVAAGTQVAAGVHTEKVGPAGVPLAASPFDQQFIDMMAAHHRMAIEMAQMALMHAKHPEIRTMARMIIRAQSKEINQFRRLRKQWYGSGQFSDYGAMSEMMQRSMGMAPNMMDGMMSGPRFDYVFLSGMIPHHAGAITMARWETQAGTHAALRTIAANIIRDQAKEIGAMIQLRVRWYGS